MTDLIERLYSMQGMGDVQLKALMDGVGPKGADEIKHLRTELMEQCRLLGMSAEREAKHLAQIAALEKESDALRAELGTIGAKVPAEYCAYSKDWRESDTAGRIDWLIAMYESVNRRVGWLMPEVQQWAESRPVSQILPPQNTGVGRPRKEAA